MTLILPPDMEAFLCDYLRTHITDVDGLQVGSKKPPDYQGAYPLVTVRDDGGNADGPSRLRDAHRTSGHRPRQGLANRFRG